MWTKEKLHLLTTMVPKRQKRGFFSMLLVPRMMGAISPTMVAIVGLDGAGGTQALYRLKLGEVIITAPTIGYYVQIVCIQIKRFQYRKC